MESSNLSPNLFKRLINSLSPNNSNLVAVFAYGSVVFPQHNRSLKNSLVDIVFIVQDPVEWHFDNIKKNPNHYNLLFKCTMKHDQPPWYLKAIISKFPGPQVYYNPFVKWHDPNSNSTILIKYGVVSFQNVLHDLLNWTDLFISGRLHKPVLWIPLDHSNHDDDSKSSLNDKRKQLVLAQKKNLLSSLSYGLLQNLPFGTRFGDFTLFHSIASISYRGDWRMFIGEDKQKVRRLVTGSERLEKFRAFYHEAFSQIGFCNVFKSVSPNYEYELESNIDLKILSSNLLENLPDSICISAAFCNSSKPISNHITMDATSARQILLELPFDERNQRLNRTVSDIVRRSSIQQTGFGLFSAGLWRSIRYGFAKFRKMLASLISVDK